MMLETAVCKMQSQFYCIIIGIIDIRPWKFSSSHTNFLKVSPDYFFSVILMKIALIVVVVVVIIVDFEIDNEEVTSM